MKKLLAILSFPLLLVLSSCEALVWYYAAQQSGSEKVVRVAKPREDGPFIEYWSNGKKYAEGTYKNKKLDGVYTEYFESGKKKSALTYVGGEWNGPYTTWFDSGQKSGEGTFKAGKLHGTNTHWHRTGRKMRESIWKDGKVVSGKYWNSKGEEFETWEESYDWSAPPNYFPRRPR